MRRGGLCALRLLHKDHQHPAQPLLLGRLDCLLPIHPDDLLANKEHAPLPPVVIEAPEPQLLKGGHAWLLASCLILGVADHCTVNHHVLVPPFWVQQHPGLL